MEKIDNITNEIMDKIRDYFWKKHDIDLNDFQSSYSDRNSDDEIYSIIHNELKKEVSHMIPKFAIARQTIHTIQNLCS